MSENLDRDSSRKLVLEKVLDADFQRATFGGPVRGSVGPWVRVVIRPVDLRGGRLLQFSYFDAKKDITKNYEPHEVVDRLQEVLDVGFAAIHIEACGEELDIRTTKKGKVLVGRRRGKPSGPEPDLTHNRVKDVPLPEGRANRLLETMGILTRDGTVRPTMRAKYTQINELLKQLTHILEDADLRSLDRPVRILDCGCGSSYLTLATHYYLNDVLGIPAQLLGVDVNEELIRKSVARSERLGAERLTFSCGPIDTAQGKPDIVLALHACDTATDDALALAVSAGAKILLSVPCCHHHLNEQLRPQGQSQLLRPLLRHGILHQRTADIITDAFRALALRIMGYKTEVVEFISAEHTSRNLLIRAVFGPGKGEAMYVKEYLEMRKFWNVVPYVEEALGRPFKSVLETSVT